MSISPNHFVVSERLPLFNSLKQTRVIRRAPLTVVLTKDEVRKILGGLNGMPWIMTMLLYGAGLRLMECCRHVLNRGGKGVRSPADELAVPNR